MIVVDTYMTKVVRNYIDDNTEILEPNLHKEILKHRQMIKYAWNLW